MQVALLTTFAVTKKEPLSVLLAVSIHFYSPAFGGQFPPGNMTAIDPGVMVTDSWWVNGRQGGVSALTSVDADPAGKKLPPLPARVAAVLNACGLCMP